jgi:hypothetical protein
MKRAAEWHRCALRIHYVNGHMDGPGPLFIKVVDHSDAEQDLHEFYQDRQDGVPIQGFSLSKLVPLFSLNNDSALVVGVGALVFEDRVQLCKGQFLARHRQEFLSALSAETNLLAMPRAHRLWSRGCLVPK